MLLDTNIFVDIFRNHKPAIKTFNQFLHGQKASVITKFELIVGSRNKRELNKILKNLNICKTEFLPATTEVCEEAENILTKFYLPHGINIEDSFIAATAIVYDEELVTRNTKHFDFIPNLKLIAPY